MLWPAVVSAANPTPPPQATPKAQPTVVPSPTPAKPTVAPTAPPTAPPAPTATRVPATAVPTSAPTQVPTPAPPTPTPPAAVASVSPSAVVTASPVPSRDAAVAAPSPGPTVVATPAGSGNVHGTTFVDDNANGQLTDSKQRLTNVEVVLTFSNGLSRTTHTDDSGEFSFDGLPPGDYHVAVTLPNDYVATSDAGRDLQIVDGADADPLSFGFITREAAGLPPDGVGPDAASDDEQIIALASVTSLPLRFAEGRDLMNQVQRRVLGDGLIWLGVPFRSQMDGGDFQYVNCGPASLTMVLAGFGLNVGPSQVRDYLNNLIDNFDTELGTSLDVLSSIASQAGLTPMDLYSDQGGYRNWSTDAVRWHVQQGHPVITLVKYRNLPGHTSSVSEFDHYIVITGLTPNGFIYNDGAFATTLGYGLEISDVELEYAWENSSIPHHAVALGLAPDRKSLTFPELPRKPSTVAADVAAQGRNARRLAAADAASAARAPLVLTPALTASAAGSWLRDAWETDSSLTADDSPPPDDPGSPMGLNMDQSEQAALEAQPGPGAEVPKLLALLSAIWLVWLLLSASRRLGFALDVTALRLYRRLPRMRRQPPEVTEAET
ncbi:MAG: C39 family peptidase [Chloroflexi bacterium]|nr:C39 family peptidase [Chloroflexota bacterium]